MSYIVRGETEQERIGGGSKQFSSDSPPTHTVPGSQSEVGVATRDKVVGELELLPTSTVHLHIITPTLGAGEGAESSSVHASTPPPLRPDLVPLQAVL